MRIRLLPVLLVVAACGGTATTTVPAGLSGSIRVSGGIAGIDETWGLASDGTVNGPLGRSGSLTPVQVEALGDAAADAGFFDLDAEYLPEDRCCDRFTYELTITQGGRTHTVTTIDAADAPDGLFALIGSWLDAMRGSVG